MLNIKDAPASFFPSGHEYLLPMFPEYDYLRPHEPEKMDYARPDNQVGYQQRCFIVKWAIEQCGRTGKVGLDIGSYGIMTPYCLSTDKFMTESHPDYNGGSCIPQLKISGEDLSIIGNGTIPLIVGNHVFEHLTGDVVKLLREQWLPKLCVGGVIAQVIPDNYYCDVMSMDSSHKQCWTAKEFEQLVLGQILDVSEVVSFNRLRNNFSFEFVVRKK